MSSNSVSIHKLAALANTRGTIYGLTGATQPAHMVRAALDSNVFQAQDVLNAMAKEAGLSVRDIRVDGGAAANDRLMRLQADLAGVPLSRAQSVETTALGAVFLAGLTVGFWRDQPELTSLRSEAARFRPPNRTAISKAEYLGWMSAVAGLLHTDLTAL